MPAEPNAVVIDRSEVAAGLIILRVAPDGWELPDWRAGQFTVLGLPGSAPRTPMSDTEDEAPDPDKLIRRAYSIASPPDQTDHLEFYITLVQSGALTPRLFALKPGDRLFLGKKITGMFTLSQVPADKNLVLVGTGTGLAPYMSMLRSEIGVREGVKTVVLLGARHSWDLGYRSELIAMQRFNPSFHYLPIISLPEEEIIEWKGEVGFVHELWDRGLVADAIGGEPTPENTHVLLCGNPMMIEAMTDNLIRKGYAEHSSKSPGQIHVEKYW